MIPNQWYAILPSKAVKTNQIVGVKRLNLELALFRNEKGVIGCVVDQCTHRGAALTRERSKETVSSVLSTGWSLTGQAAVILSPQTEKHRLPISADITSRITLSGKAMALFTYGMAIP
jgi:phenylpropionate dioxygenase-like ring-hydroxylating dioxygenase large terminal subunit